MLKSMTRVPPEVVSVPKEAVPVAFALLSFVMALAVNTPPEGAGAKVADKGNSASNVLPDKAVSGLVGRVPE
jgi:hypothetical protein